jgi:transcription elongation factor Elf1
MGRRRRRIVKVVKKKLPSVFECPKCGESSVKITFSKGSGIATIQCGSCGLKETIEVSSTFEAVDAYCKFVDNFYKKIEANV